MIPFGGSRYNMLFSQRINGKQCNLTLLCPLLMPCSKICSTNLDNKDHSFTMKTWRLRHLNKLPKATDIIYAEDGFRIDIWGPRLGSVLELIYTDYKIFRGIETRTEVSEKWFREARLTSSHWWTSPWMHASVPGSFRTPSKLSYCLQSASQDDCLINEFLFIKPSDEEYAPWL